MQNNYTKEKAMKVLTIILSVLGVIALVVGVFLLGKGFSSNSDGTITVEVVALDGSIIRSENIEFSEGDTLVTLIEENFDNVVIDQGMIMTIEDYVTPSDWSTFLSIKVDDVESMVGITSISFTDGTKISLVITEFIYE